MQATDRLVMIQSIGRLELQVITAIGWSVAVMLYSPWLMLLLIAAVLPAFLGETHFAFLGYAKNFRQTPIKRQLDYLRQAGATKEAAKELKLFNLSAILHPTLRQALGHHLSARRRPGAETPRALDQSCRSSARADITALMRT